MNWYCWDLNFRVGTFKTNIEHVLDPGKVTKNMTRPLYGETLHSTWLTKRDILKANFTNENGIQNRVKFETLKIFSSLLFSEKKHFGSDCQILNRMMMSTFDVFFQLSGTQVVWSLVRIQFRKVAFTLRQIKRRKMVVCLQNKHFYCFF